MLNYHSFVYHNFNFLKLHEYINWLKTHIGEYPGCEQIFQGNWWGHVYDEVNIHELNLPWYIDYNKYYYDIKEKHYTEVVTVFIKDDDYAVQFKLMDF